MAGAGVTKEIAFLRVIRIPSWDFAAEIEIQAESLTAMHGVGEKLIRRDAIVLDFRGEGFAGGVIAKPRSCQRADAAEKEENRSDAQRGDAAQGSLTNSYVSQEEIREAKEEQDAAGGTESRPGTPVFR